MLISLLRPARIRSSLWACMCTYHLHSNTSRTCSSKRTEIRVFRIGGIMTNVPCFSTSYNLERPVAGDLADRHQLSIGCGVCMRALTFGVERPD